MPSSAQRSASQVPGEDTLNRHHQAVTVGGNGLEKRFRRGFHVAVQHDFPFVTQDTDVQASGMQIDTTVKWVLVGVEAPEVSSSSVSGFSQCQLTIVVG
jgi:hypothetical protein